MDEIENEDDDDVVFVYQEDPECKVNTQIKDLEIGEAFIYMNKRFQKRNAMGWIYGVGNVMDMEGQISHLHPATCVSRIQ